MILTRAAAVARDTVRIVDTLRLVDTVWVTQPAHGFVEIASAWSTVAVAALAVVALGRELWQGRQKRLAMDSQITGVAYAVRRQIKSWLRSPASVDITWASRLVPEHFDIAEGRFEVLMHDAPFASRGPRKAIYRAFLLFNVATRRVNENLAAFNLKYWGGPTHAFRFRVFAFRRFDARSSSDLYSRSSGATARARVGTRMRRRSPSSERQAPGESRAGASRPPLTSRTPSPEPPTTTNACPAVGSLMTSVGASRGASTPAGVERSPVWEPCRSPIGLPCPHLRLSALRAGAVTGRCAGGRGGAG